MKRIDNQSVILYPVKKKKSPIRYFHYLLLGVLLLSPFLLLSFFPATAYAGSRFSRHKSSVSTYQTGSSSKVDIFTARAKEAQFEERYKAEKKECLWRATTAINQYLVHISFLQSAIKHCEILNYLAPQHKRFDVQGEHWKNLTKTFKNNRITDLYRFQERVPFNNPDNWDNPNFFMPSAERIEREERAKKIMTPATSRIINQLNFVHRRNQLLLTPPVAKQQVAVQPVAEQPVAEQPVAEHSSPFLTGVLQEIMSAVDVNWTRETALRTISQHFQRTPQPPASEPAPKPAPEPAPEQRFPFPFGEGENKYHSDVKDNTYHVPRTIVYNIPPPTAKETKYRQILQGNEKVQYNYRTMERMDLDLPNFPAYEAINPPSLRDENNVQHYLPISIRNENSKNTVRKNEFDLMQDSFFFEYAKKLNPHFFEDTTYKIHIKALHLKPIFFKLFALKYDTPFTFLSPNIDKNYLKDNFCSFLERNLRLSSFSSFSPSLCTSDQTKMRELWSSLSVKDCFKRSTQEAIANSDPWKFAERVEKLYKFQPIRRFGLKSGKEKREAAIKKTHYNKYVHLGELTEYWQELLNQSQQLVLMNNFYQNYKSHQLLKDLTPHEKGGNRKVLSRVDYLVVANNFERIKKYREFINKKFQINEECLGLSEPIHTHIDSLLRDPKYGERDLPLREHLEQCQTYIQQSDLEIRRQQHYLHKHLFEDVVPDLETTNAYIYQIHKSVRNDHQKNTTHIAMLENFEVVEGDIKKAFDEMDKMEEYEKYLENFEVVEGVEEYITKFLTKSRTADGDLVYRNDPQLSKGEKKLRDSFLASDLIENEPFKRKFAEYCLAAKSIRDAYFQTGEVVKVYEEHRLASPRDFRKSCRESKIGIFTPATLETITGFAELPRGENLIEGESLHARAILDARNVEARKTRQGFALLPVGDNLFGVETVRAETLARFAELPVGYNLFKDQSA